ncbi:hypothetical protein GCM10009801_82110 [Streptomyces albiaxialis]|uniref:RNA polymerase sigma-70 region 4 domain-containing protein n=1 Tax=Streptomyces albiaxialis TaxID=329523 RepID=A0ABP5IT12_9ACTN
MTPQPRPDDELDHIEAARILGVEPGTVRGYASRGTLSPGPRWSRREIEARKKAEDGRAKAVRRSPAEQRAETVAQWLTAAQLGKREKVTLRDIREEYGVSERTAIRTLARARELADEPQD